MTLRKISTEVDFETDPWTPPGETFVQFDGATFATTELVVYCRVDDTAAWVEGFRTKPMAGVKIWRFAQVPRMKVSVLGNQAGNQVKISTGEI